MGARRSDVGGGRPVGWGRDWDRAEAAGVLRAAFDAGISVFDTADAYGAGTAERLIGEALSSVRDEIAIVTKWGNLIDEGSRRLVGTDASPGYVRRALDASHRRLRTDRVDLYLLHLAGLPATEAEDLRGTLQDLVGSGEIGAYGWSTDDPELAAAWIGAARSAPSDPPLRPAGIARFRLTTSSSLEVDRGPCPRRMHCPRLARCG